MPNPINQSQPDVPKTRGMGIPERMRNIAITEDQVATLAVVLLDQDANPVDLTQYGLGDEGSSVSQSASNENPTVAKICLAVREYVGISTTGAVSVEATIKDAQTGTVNVLVPEAVRTKPGIYRASLQALDADDNLLFANELLLTVNRGVTSKNQKGPLSIPEIRLHIRDSAPEENYLLDAVTFSDVEIAACMARCVDFWNDIMPPLRRKYTTHTFPYRFYWLEGTVSQLFFLAAEFYQKNDLQAAAGGIQVSDMAKAQYYLQQAATRWNEFKTWARGAKIAENLRGGSASLRSSYSSNSRY